MAYQRDNPVPNRVRVAVTGAGIVTAHGVGCSINASAFRQGMRSLRPISLFDTTRQRVHNGGEAELPQDLPAAGLSYRQAARLDRATQMLLLAGHECLAQSGWAEASSAQEVPLIFGTSAAAMSLGETYYRRKTDHPAVQRRLAHLAQLYQPAQQVRLLADSLGISGPVRIIANACASGSNAIGTAFHLVKHGHARRVMTGGYDALCQLVFAGFDSLQALSTTQPRPFAADRDGLALGEGAAVLALEPLEDALARQATILGEITGYGAATDLHHLTQPHPDGIAAVQSMTAACNEAGWSPADVDYINAHGTGTPLNDASEGAAIVSWAGLTTERQRVSSIKGSIGHLLGGAGAVEAVVSLMSLGGGWLPPNVPVPDPDPVCRFQLVQQPTDFPVRRLLSNSFGFGGANATLAIQHSSLALT